MNNYKRWYASWYLSGGNYLGTKPQWSLIFKRSKLAHRCSVEFVQYATVTVLYLVLCSFLSLELWSKIITEIAVANLFYLRLASHCAPFFNFHPRKGSFYENLIQFYLSPFLLLHCTFCVCAAWKVEPWFTFRKMKTIFKNLFACGTELHVTDWLFESGSSLKRFFEVRAYIFGFQIGPKVVGRLQLWILSCLYVTRIAHWYWDVFLLWMSR